MLIVPLMNYPEQVFLAIISLIFICKMDMIILTAEQTSSHVVWVGKWYVPFSLLFLFQLLGKHSQLYFSCWENLLCPLNCWWFSYTSNVKTKCLTLVLSVHIPWDMPHWFPLKTVYNFNKHSSVLSYLNKLPSNVRKKWKIWCSLEWEEGINSFIFNIIESCPHLTLPPQYLKLILIDIMLVIKLFLKTQNCLGNNQVIHFLPKFDVSFLLEYSNQFPETSKYHQIFLSWFWSIPKL